MLEVATAQSEVLQMIVVHLEQETAVGAMLQERRPAASERE